MHIYTCTCTNIVPLIYPNRSTVVEEVDGYQGYHSQPGLLLRQVYDPDVCVLTNMQQRDETEPTG